MTDAVDVVIVGSGPAGVAAAIAASDAGATWIGLEASERLGGTALLSGGGCCFAGTSTQRALGIVDSPDLAVSDLLADNADAEKDWARSYFGRCEVDVHDWLLARGVRFAHVRHQDELAEFQSVPRWHQPEGAGRGLMSTLHESLARTAAPTGRFLAGARVVGILEEPVAVVRVEERGLMRDVRTKTLVMATGGFNGNATMLKRHASPSIAGMVLCGGGPGATGDGHRLLADRDATLINMDHLWCYLYAMADHDDPAREHGFAIWGIADNVWVTRAGLRFHDESLRGAGHAMPAWTRSSGGSCFAILDRRVADGMQVLDPRYRAADGTFLDERREDLLARSSEVTRADTLEELATNAGIDPRQFTSTLEAWNQLVRSGAQRDPHTGRSLTAVAPLERPPFYALRFRPLARKNLGGVRTDLQCRVLNRKGRPLVGLYAAGELCGFGGGSMAGSKALEGMMIGASLFTGRVAGASASHAAGHPAPNGWT